MLHVIQANDSTIKSYNTPSSGHTRDPQVVDGDGACLIASLNV